MRQIHLLRGILMHGTTNHMIQAQIQPDLISIPEDDGDEIRVRLE